MPLLADVHADLRGETVRRARPEWRERGKADDVPVLLGDDDGVPRVAPCIWRTRASTGSGSVMKVAVVWTAW
jgi:hypothetical protein